MMLLAVSLGTALVFLALPLPAAPSCRAVSGAAALAFPPASLALEVLSFAPSLHPASASEEASRSAARAWRGRTECRVRMCRYPRGSS